MITRSTGITGNYIGDVYLFQSKIGIYFYRGNVRSNIVTSVIAVAGVLEWKIIWSYMKQINVVVEHDST